MKIVDSQDCDYNAAEAASFVEDMLQKYGEGEIQAIYCHNDVMAQAACEVLAAAGRDDEGILVCGMDGEEASYQLIESGAMAFTIIYPTMAPEDIIAAYNILTGQEQEPVVTCTSTMVGRFQHRRIHRHRPAVIAADTLNASAEDGASAPSLHREYRLGRIAGEGHYDVKNEPYHQAVSGRQGAGRCLHIGRGWGCPGAGRREWRGQVHADEDSLRRLLPWTRGSCGSTVSRFARLRRPR